MGTFPKCRARLGSDPALGPLFWDCTYPRVLLYKNLNLKIKPFFLDISFVLVLSGDRQPHSTKKPMEEQMKEYVTILCWPWQSCTCVATTKLTRNAHMELTREWWQQTVQCSLHQNQNLWENIDQQSNWIAWRYVLI